MKQFFYVIIIVMLCFACCYLENRVSKLEKAVQHYEERQLSLISQDKAIREELADLKRYIQTRVGTGG
ncbi:hypothetical protein ACTGU6_03615 [Streptococcus suis]